jgi:hypothetical protein
MQHNKWMEHQECQTLIKIPTHTNSKPKKKGEVWLICVLVVWKPRFQWTQFHGHIANPPPPCICFLLLNSFLSKILKENACIICCHKRRAWGEWSHGSTSSSKVSFYFFKHFGLISHLCQFFYNCCYYTCVFGTNCKRFQHCQLSFENIYVKWTSNLL